MDDEVIVRWDAETLARDGTLYHNSYAWFFTMRGGTVVEMAVFLDLAAYGAILARVAPSDSVSGP